MKQNSDVLATFNEWKIMIKKYRRKQVKCLCIDNGLEFCYDEFNALYSTTKWCGEGNEQDFDGESMFMLFNVGLPKSFYVEAVSITCFLINCSLSTAIDKRTPQ